MFFLGLLIVLAIGVPMIWLLGRKKPPKVETAEQKVDAVLDQQDKDIDGFQKKVASLISKRDGLADDLKLADDEVSKWSMLLEVAAPSQKEADIRACVRGKMEAEQHQKAVSGEIGELDKIIDGLNERLKFARTKVDDARANKTTLAARLDAAKIGAELADKNVDLGALEDETIKQEAKAEAYEETSPDHQKFLKNNVVSNLDVDAEVARLMKK